MKIYCEKDARNWKLIESGLLEPNYKLELMYDATVVLEWNAPMSPPRKWSTSVGTIGN